MADHFIHIEGLSPRVRGSRTVNLKHHLVLRSIPASTGQPVWSSMRRVSSKVYPREYGAASLRSVILPADRGLSPRVRGSLQVIGRPRPDTRSIPASTGQPASPRPYRLRLQVYPREYGAACFPKFPSSIRYGLSPRVRGSLSLVWTLALNTRSIPASTGQPRHCR